MFKLVHLYFVVLLLAFVFADEDSHDEIHTSDFDSHDDHEHDDHEDGDAGLAMAITIAAGFAAFLGAFAGLSNSSQNNSFDAITDQVYAAIFCFAVTVFCVKPEQLRVLPAALGFSSGVVCMYFMYG